MAHIKLATIKTRPLMTFKWPKNFAPAKYILGAPFAVFALVESDCCIYLLKNTLTEYKEQANKEQNKSRAKHQVEKISVILFPL